MLEKTVKVSMTKGAEERPVAVLVQIASQYESQIHLIADDKKDKCKEHHGYDEHGILRRTAGYDCCRWSR